LTKRVTPKRIGYVVKNNKGLYIGYPQGGFGGQKYRLVEDFQSARVFARERDADLNISYRVSQRNRKAFSVVPVTISIAA
jgi:hypothetical protein